MDGGGGEEVVLDHVRISVTNDHFQCRVCLCPHR